MLFCVSRGLFAVSAYAPAHHSPNVIHRNYTNLPSTAKKGDVVTSAGDMIEG